jgi:hypothetical protein
VQNPLYGVHKGDCQNIWTTSFAPALIKLIISTSATFKQKLLSELGSPNAILVIFLLSTNPEKRLEIDSEGRLDGIVARAADTQKGQ